VDRIRVSVAPLGLSALCLFLAVACTESSQPTGKPSRPQSSATGTADDTSTARPEPERTKRSAGPRAGSPAAIVADMTRKQRIGQVIMTGADSTGIDQPTYDAITSYHVGNVMLTGRSELGVTATAAGVRTLKDEVSQSSTAGVPLYVATDQEGGLVQVLRGPGFTSLPSGLDQGRMTPRALRTAAERWGDELRDAGVNVNLAPVMDTVPSAAFAPRNKPIGAFDRQYGYTAARVTSRGLAFARGMGDAGVAPVVKHFPGLGLVTANTDVSSGVTDRTTTRRDPYLEPFAAAVKDDQPFMMMSTAYYAKIDPDNPAAFSSTIIGGILRERLGFDGIVISDDLSNATQVARWTPGQRAVKFVAAGGDMVLGVDPAQAPAMARALLRRAKSDAAFDRLVDKAAVRIVAAKKA